MDVGADDFRFPIFHLARLTLESDKGQEAEEIYRQMQGGGMGEGKKKRSTRKESSVCKSELRNERRFIPSNGPRVRIA